jgi:hypothetical protein
MSHISPSLSKKNINFILAAFMMIDYDHNGLLETDFEHYFLNNIIHEEVDGSVSHIFEDSLEKMNFYRKLLQKMVFENYIFLKNGRYFVNYKIEKCQSYLNLYLRLMDGFNIKSKGKIFEEDSVYEDENTIIDENYSLQLKGKEEEPKDNFIEMSNINNAINEIVDENSHETTETKCQFKYMIHSFSNSKTKYMVDEKFTICTCESFRYSLTEPKNCKHLDYCRGVDVSNLTLI